MPANPQEFQRLRVGLQAFEVTDTDLKTVVLRRLGQVHRKQEERIFAAEGAAGRSGKWAALSPAYAAAKRKLFPGRKILVRTGVMKEAFIRATNPDYVQRYVKPLMQFGARSRVATYHDTGTSTMPRRDPVGKTETQLEQLREAILIWYRKERVPQAQRAMKALGGA